MNDINKLWNEWVESSKRVIDVMDETDANSELTRIAKRKEQEAFAAHARAVFADERNRQSAT